MAMLALCAAGPAWFDRKKETDYLSRFVKEQRGQLLLITGPSGCGKSAILRQLWMREPDRVSITDLTILNFASTIAKFSGETNYRGEPLKLRDKQRERAQGLEVVQPVPTIFFDNANVLDRWPVADEGLESFRRCLTTVSEGDYPANVVLVTSDYFWLPERIGPLTCTHHVIGDLTEPEARGMFELELGRACSDELFQEVYALCGGRVPLLSRAAGELRDSEQAWPRFREHLLGEVLEHLFMGITPWSLFPRAVSPAWSREGYKAALVEMCKHPGGVMPWEDFVACSGGSDAAESLVCHKRVVCRPYSPLARDLDWYGRSGWPVVTPVSQVHFLAMQELVKEFVKT